MQVPCSGVCVEREADGPVGRVLLRRRAARAHHRAEARRPDAPTGTGEPRRMGTTSLHHQCSCLQLQLWSLWPNSLDSFLSSLRQARPVLVDAVETGDLDAVVDPRLDGAYNMGEMIVMVEAAAACVRHSAPKRPRMVQVIKPVRLSDDSETNLCNVKTNISSTPHESNGVV